MGGWRHHSEAAGTCLGPDAGPPKYRNFAPSRLENASEWRSRADADSPMGRDVLGLKSTMRVCARLFLVGGLAALAYYAVPRGSEAYHLLAIADAPAAISSTRWRRN